MIIEFQGPERRICPEGPIRAKLVRVNEPKRKQALGCDEQVQLTFEASKNKRTYGVYRKFCRELWVGSELHTFLSRMCDGDFEPFLNSQGQLDTELLIGTECDLLISHYQDDDHVTPFVNIQSAHPAGTFIPLRDAGNDSKAA